MQLKSLIEQYLNQAKILQVVTAQDDQPWACTVYFAYDEQLNLYWISTPTRRHSTEIKNNSKVAGTIVLPHTPGDKVRGIQLQGTAKELTDKTEAAIGMKYYAERFGMKPERAQKIIEGADNHVCYKLSPSSYVLFDELNFAEEPRQELRLGQ